MILAPKVESPALSGLPDAIYKEIVKNSPTAEIIADLSGFVLMANRQAELMFQYQDDELRGKSIDALVPEAKRTHHAALRNAYSKHPQSRKMGVDRALFGQRKGGDLFPIELSLTPIRIADRIFILVCVVDMIETTKADQLQAASSYARSLIEASLDPLVTISAEGKITDVNEGSIKATGIPREKLIGTDFSDYFTEPEKAREGYQRVFAKGFVTDYPLTIRHCDGRLMDVLYNASVYRDAEGNVLGVFAAARDVTESKRVMRDFTETKRLLDNILESSIKYSIIGTDLHHRVLSWNEGAHRNYGYAVEEILGKSSDLLHTPDNIQSGQVRILQEAALKSGLAEGDYERVRKDGTRFWASVVVTRRIDADGKPIGYLIMSSDISAKMQAENQLHAASSYARSLIEASLDPLVTISAEGKITDVNEGSIKATGVPRGRLIGTDFSDYFTEPEKAREGYQQVFAKGFVTDYPLTIRHRDGQLMDVLYNASVYRDAKGNVLGVFAAARDVSAQKRAEAEVAEQRSRELDRLADLERFQKLTVGRELKMIELKKEIEALRKLIPEKGPSL